jgi:hypothetical protein
MVEPGIRDTVIASGDLTPADRANAVFDAITAEIAKAKAKFPNYFTNGEKKRYTVKDPESGNERLHRPLEEGPAYMDHESFLFFTDGKPHGPQFARGDFSYYWKGRAIPNELWDNRETMTIGEVVGKWQNEEIKAVAVDMIIYFQPAANLEADLSLFQQDDWGILFEVRGCANVRLLRLVNYTAEPDGSYKIYWLVVPRTNNGVELNTAHKAVADTFGKRAEDYSPAFQS